MNFEEWSKHIDYKYFAMQPPEVVKRALHMAWQASRNSFPKCDKCGQYPVLHCENCGRNWDLAE
jgi:hypothetical protein